MDGLEFDGLNDLVDGLENAVSKYPDLAEASLKREQRDFKKGWKRFMRKLKNDTNQRTESKLYQGFA